MFPGELTSPVRELWLPLLPLNSHTACMFARALVHACAFIILWLAILLSLTLSLSRFPALCLCFSHPHILILNLVSNNAGKKEKCGSHFRIQSKREAEVKQPTIHLAAKGQSGAWKEENNKIISVLILKAFKCQVSLPHFKLHVCMTQIDVTM